MDRWKWEIQEFVRTNKLPSTMILAKACKCMVQMSGIANLWVYVITLCDIVNSSWSVPFHPCWNLLVSILMRLFCLLLLVIPCVPSIKKFFVLQHQLEEEQKLAKQQDEFLKSNYKKYDMLDSVRADGTVRRVARHYDVIIRDDWRLSLS